MTVYLFWQYIKKLGNDHLSKNRVIYFGDLLIGRFSFTFGWEKRLDAARGLVTWYKQYFFWGKICFEPSYRLNDYHIWVVIKHQRHDKHHACHVVYCVYCAIFMFTPRHDNNLRHCQINVLFRQSVYNTVFHFVFQCRSIFSFITWIEMWSTISFITSVSENTSAFLRRGVPVSVVGGWVRIGF